MMSDQDRIRELETRLGAAEQWQLKAERVFENHQKTLTNILLLLRAAHEQLRALRRPAPPLTGQN